MTTQIIVTLVVGALALAAAWLPVMLQRLPLTLPIAAVLFGGGAFMAAGQPDLLPYRQGWEILTEYVLVIAVMGAGLKIDRAFRWRTWASAWRLLVVALPISIALTAFVAGWISGLPLALALLLAAVLSPTDPVLASDVQVGPPGEGESGEVRFALTSEAGLNDGIAMPFVVLAIELARGAEPNFGFAAHWAAIDLGWHVASGAALGALCGWGLVRLDHLLPERYQLKASRDGLAVLGLSLLVYGGAEIVHANGFVAVFATAVASRNTSKSDTEFARSLHGFGDQLERLAMVLIMAVFGAQLADGLLKAMYWRDLIFVAAVLFVVRPLAVWAASLGSPLPGGTRVALGYFGIRGLGSLFYIAFALARLDLDEADRLRAIVGLTVLVSVVLYGLSSSAVMRRVDARREEHGPIYKGPVLSE